jgi:hypothetical protein
MQRMQKLFPLFETDIERFLTAYGRDDKTEDDYAPHTPGRK